MTSPVPPPHTPEELMAAASFHPDCGDVYPSRIGVFCDGCGTQVVHEYIVNDRMPKAERLELARAHLRKHGWACPPDYDLCPKCREEARS